MLVHLVRSYYRHTKFCIITPYDAQRAAIQANLKATNLPWQEVYNVDSFQGLIPSHQCVALPNPLPRK